MASEKEFEAAQARVKQLSFTPQAAQLLALYGLFKQATVGDAQGKRPGMIEFKARAKFDAWTERQGQSADEARIAYVQLVEKLVAADG